MLHESSPLLFDAVKTSSYTFTDEEISIDECAEDSTALMPRITDDQAEKLLPGYSIAFEAYHLRRSAGASPEEALVETLDEWRNLWNNTAYVPHRRN